MKPVSKQLSGAGDRFKIVLDQDLFERVNADMQENGGRHKPNAHWSMSRLFKNRRKRESPSFSDMLDPWVGQGVMKTATAEDVQAYQEFLKRFDDHGISAHYNQTFTEGKARKSFWLSDLGTVHDVTVIGHFLKPERPRARILEIGGGYGRLAEAVLNVFGGQQAFYVLVDAVPASVVYSHAYLKQNLPNHRIGFYYNGDAFDPEQFDCYIVPAWHLESCIGDMKFDLAMNIASFQEMETDAVNYYIDLFDRVVRENGIVHLCNSRDFIYAREYDYPANWKIVFKDQCPRSRTIHYPLEIFEKTSVDCTAHNQPIQIRYYRELMLRYADKITRLRRARDRFRDALKNKEKEEAAGLINNLKRKLRRKAA